MGCLYCGKIIGPLRLLQDDEFCSVAHRKRYGVRLGKALEMIGAPEPAPSGVAGFLANMSLQEGNRASAARFQQFQHPAHGIKNLPTFSLSIPSRLDARLKPNHEALCTFEKRQGSTGSVHRCQR